MLKYTITQNVRPEGAGYSMRTDGRTDRQTGRNNEANGRSSQFPERA